MTSTMIDSGLRDGTLWLTLDAPERGNTLDHPALAELLDILEGAATDGEVRALCLRGRGPDFCLGERLEDTGEWPARFAANLHTGEDAASDIVHQAVLSSWWRMPKPTAVVLTGRTDGYGFDLACAADLRIAAAGATIGDSRVRHGLCASTGMSYLLPRLIGLSQASRFLLLGDEVDAREAQRIALVHEVIDDASVDEHVGKKFAGLATMATRSYALIKQQIIEQLDLPYDMALLHSLAIRQTNVIEDLAEGMRAFREKRPPRFTGR